MCCARAMKRTCRKCSSQQHRHGPGLIRAAVLDCSHKIIKPKACSANRTQQQQQIQSMQCKYNSTAAAKPTPSRQRNSMHRRRLSRSLLSWLLRASFSSSKPLDWFGDKAGPSDLMAPVRTQRVNGVLSCSGL
jgi:hypothetical protein